MRLFCWTCCVDEDQNILSAYNAENTPWLTMEGQRVRCKVVDVYDADTVTLIIPFGDGPNNKYQKKCRLTGIDAAEKRTRNDLEKKVALQGKEWLENQVLNRELWVECGDWDKYGRLLGTLYMSARDMRTGWDASINLQVVNKGYGYLYDGKKKRDFNDWYGDILME